MNNVEEDLKRALRRLDPPPDFVGKIMNRVGSDEGLEAEPQARSNKVLPFRSKPRVMVWLATAAAAACLVGLFVTRSYVTGPRRGLSAPGSGWVSEKHPTEEPANTQATPTAPGGDVNKATQNQVAEGAAQQGIQHKSIRPYRRAIASHPSEEARRAEEQLRLALAITSAKLGYAQRSIQEADGTGSPGREVNR